MPPEEFTIRTIESGDSVTGFSLGDSNLQPLKSFLQNEALEHHNCNLTKTYVLVDAAENNQSVVPKVWGYISLLCSNVELSNEEDHPEDVDDYRYTDFPAVKIARLAIDRRIKGKGFGTTLVQLAIAISNENIMPNIGCRFVVVDSKQNAVDFYKRLGFTIIAAEGNDESDAPIMYLDLVNAS